MQATVEKKDIQDALKLVLPIAKKAKKTTLAGIRMRAIDNKMVLESSTNTAGVSIQVKADVQEEGLAAVDEESFACAIGGMDWSFCISKVLDRVTIDDGKTSFQMPVKEAESEIIDAAHDESICVCGLDSILSLCAPFVCKEGERPVFEGICLRNVANKMSAVATDGIRLAVVETSEPWLDSDAIIPMDAARMLMKKEWGGEVEVWRKGNRIFFSNGSATISTLCIEEEFPDFSKVIPKKDNTRITIARDVFLSALKSASGFSSKIGGRTRFEVNGTALCVVAFSERGEFKTSIPVMAEGINVTFFASWLYMHTAANLCDGDLVHVHVLDDATPIVMRGASKNVTFVVMPIAQ